VRALLLNPETTLKLPEKVGVGEALTLLIVHGLVPATVQPVGNRPVVPKFVEYIWVTWEYPECENCNNIIRNIMPGIEDDTF